MALHTRSHVQKRKICPPKWRSLIKQATHATRADQELENALYYLVLIYPILIYPIVTLDVRQNPIHSVPAHHELSSYLIPIQAKPVYPTLPTFI